MDSEIIAAIIGAFATVAAAVVGIWTQVRKTNERVDRLFYYTMSGPMYENLRKLAHGQFMHYEMSEGLKRELYHLRDTGFIEIPSIKQIPFKGGSLQQYAKVTDVGRQFVETREKLEAK